MPPQEIGRYRILRDLGQGATATVYLARDPGSGRQVAVKILSPVFTAAPDFASRFEQALTALTALEHPFIVAPQDRGQDGDQFFVVTRYLPGGTLADRMDGRPMLLAEVVPILQRLAEALDAAHAAHVLHGDLHPADVLFDLRDRAFLSDLGLAQLLDPVPGPNPTGTAAYMSPEQIAGQPIDGRADVYALGVLLFEMLTGRQPYPGPTPQDLLRQHLEQPVPQLTAAELARLVLPLEFNLVIARALAKNRDHRYPTAGVLAEAVRTTFLMAPTDSAPEPATVAPVAPPPFVPPIAPPPAPEAATTTAVPEAPQAASPAAEPPVISALVSPAASDATVTTDAIAPLVPSAPETPLAAAAEPAPAASDTSEPAFMPPGPPFVPPPPGPAQPAPRRGPAPGTLLLGFVGLMIVIVFLILLRYPDFRALVLAPTATSTPTITASATVTASPSATSTSSATPSATASSTTTATPSPTFTPTATDTPSPTISPTETTTPTRTPRPTLPPFTATALVTAAPAATSAITTSAAPTQSHLGPPPGATQ